VTSNIKTITLGCRLNAYESNIISTFKANLKHNNVVVINTCSVTSTAEKEGIKLVKKLKKRSPDSFIIATGCAVELNQVVWKNMPEIDKTILNKNKLKPSLWGLEPEINSKEAIIEDAKHLQILKSNSQQTRAFIRIQNGCNHSCTFCAITLARGNSESVPSGSIINEIKILVSHGVQEVVLTGVDLTSYGEDLPGDNNLGKLVKKILKFIPDLKRLRISSLDAAEIDMDLLEVLKHEERIMPHIHLSLQSHDDLILKRMKRRHTTKDAENLIYKLKNIRPNILFGADLISGFPTENEEAFKNTLNAIKKLDLTFLHVFPYSPRPGTPAARMPQIPTNIRKERAKMLREQGNKVKYKVFKDSINSYQNVLIETEKGFGHAENFLPVKISEKVKTNNIYKCKITGIRNNILIGKINGFI